jgi:hypothetical protein
LRRVHAADRVVVDGDKPCHSELAGVELFPGRWFGFERRVAGGDAFAMDALDVHPIGGDERANRDRCHGAPFHVV